MALNGLLCADVPLRIYTHPLNSQLRWINLLHTSTLPPPLTGKQRVVTFHKMSMSKRYTTVEGKTLRKWGFSDESEQRTVLRQRCPQKFSVVYVVRETSLHVLCCVLGWGIRAVAEAVGCTVSGELRVSLCHWPSDR